MARNSVPKDCISVGHSYKPLGSPYSKILSTKESKPEQTPSCGCRCAGCGKHCNGPRVRRSVLATITEVVSNSLYVRLYCARCENTVEQIVEEHEGSTVRQQDTYRAR